MKKLFFLCIALTAHFTLYPWTFAAFHDHSTILEGLRPLSGRGDYLDIVVNLCFYVPLGVLGVLAWWKGSGTAARWISLVAFGAALSLTLETIQAWVPGRDSSLLDVFNNTIGTIAGARLGVAIAGRLPPGLRLELPSPRRSVPAILIAAWLMSQWFPFLPILRVPHFSESLQALMQISSLGWIDLADAFVGALLIGRLLREVLSSSAYRAALAAACLVLPARLFLVVEAAPWPLAVASAAGLLLSAPALFRSQSGTWLLAAAAALLVAARELQPFQFAGTAEPFYWIPFSGFLEDLRSSAIRVTSGKFFLYGAAVWMIRETGVSLRMATAGIAGLLVVGEWAQRYMPGRVAESTDPILAVIAAFMIVWLKDGRPTPVPPGASIGRVRKIERPFDRRG